MKYCFSVLVGLFLLLIGVFAVNNAIDLSVTTECNEKYRTVILDAGHGGEDGGAVAPDGTLEKDINLKIADDTGALFDLFGIDYIPVRTTDVSVCDDGLKTIRQRKYSDIMNRAALIGSVDNGLLLSIHQNFYQDPKYYGIQVFYAPSPEDSAVLAGIIRDSVTRHLQPENKREIKTSDGSIYLLDKAEKTSVLVECGFLSNPQELALLKDATYEAQLSYFIFRGILSFLSNEREV